MRLGEFFNVSIVGVNASINVRPIAVMVAKWDVRPFDFSLKRICVMEETSGSLVLIAEDDPKTASLIASYLEKEAIATLIASCGRQALELFERHLPGLVILDVMLPKLNGLDVCTAIRKASHVPIVFLTARDEEADKVLALGIGGDDYIAKPFSPRELVARIKAQLRRAKMSTKWATSASPQRAPLAHGGLTFDDVKRRFALNGKPLSLTPIEFTLLKTLIEKPGQVFLRNELLDQLYSHGEIVVDRVIDVHIGKLRQKIGDNPAQPTFIHTVRGLGYRFADCPG
jgi:DNA-binding response OmpR family regulator